eukprot:TRINITY_DN125269_c0_g1_i1.p1 TRINITY_DN125269_c0_g1~~TRINITY_DN125269_c0_g1_i1.p1  ORF type:complete len:336 (-),score=50.08 TRINITY_DN125269_c0_g1_i1:233-1240(-)
MLRSQLCYAVGALLPSIGLTGEISIAEEAKELATVWNPSRCSATLFGGDIDDPRYWHVKFPPGDYSMKNFERRGAKNDQTSSIRVRGDGCEATVFGGDLDDMKSWQYTFKEGEYNFDEHIWQQRGIVDNDVSSIRVQSPDHCSATVFGGNLDETDTWAVTFKEGEYSKADFLKLGAKPESFNALRVFGYGCVAQTWAEDLDDPEFWCDSFPEGEYAKPTFWRRGGKEEVVSAIRIRHAADVDNARCATSGEEVLAQRRRRSAAHSFVFYIMMFCAATLVSLFAWRKMTNPHWSPMHLEHELSIGHGPNDGLVASVTGAMGMRPAVQRPDDGYWLG